MTTFTETSRACASILSEANGSRSRGEVTILAGSGVVLANTVLGKITASGKYKPATAAGADGAQIASAISLYDADATTADVVVAAALRDAEINGAELTYDATVNDAAKKAAKADQLASAHLIIR